MLDWIEQIDFIILDWIQNHFRGEILDFLMPLITMLGDGGIFFALLALFLLCSKKYRQQGKVLLGALILCLLCGNLLLKPLVARIRPYDLKEGFELLISPLRDYSFPSGHTMASAAAAVVFWKYRRIFGKWAVFMVGAAGLIAFSRLYLYVHFPTDVLSGAMLGIGMAILSIKLNEKISFGKLKMKQNKLQ